MLLNDARPLRAAILFLLLSAYCLVSCKTLPEIPITTPKPLEVNLNMRLDVYQYRGDEPVDKEAVRTIAEATQRMRNRMEEIQTIKSNRFVGEDHRGLLQLREVPGGTWGDYVKQTVAAENEDRLLLMRNEAKESKRALHDVEQEQWRLRSEKSFPGEYIEVPGDAAGTFKWVQAEGVKLKEDAKPAEVKK
ncbi:MAG: DUF1318 domain-containing protein [Verrucomicrobiaceae bacterium]|nr:DUF1318 domain-containing protein [Verrucomicrobiaceae bacterium]